MYSSTVPSLYKPPNLISFRVRSRASKHKQDYCCLRGRQQCLARIPKLCNCVPLPLACDFSILMPVIGSVGDNTRTDSAIPRFAGAPPQSSDFKMCLWLFELVNHLTLSDHFSRRPTTAHLFSHVRLQLFTRSSELQRSPVDFCSP
jgi:hypothetical protein